MARLNRLRSLLGFRSRLSHLLKLRRWLVGMAERCCRARRCGLVSLVVVELRVVSQRLAKAVVVIAIVETVVESAADVGGIAGVVAMRTRVGGASVRMRRVLMRCRRSSMRSRVG
jgi:hypothetical protein